MIALVRMGLPALATLALTGCVGFPAYQGPAPGAPTAVVDIHRINANSICTDGKFYSIPSANNGKLLLPATGRVGIYSFMSIADYNVTYTCAPGLSFHPEPGQEYMMNVETDGKGCKLEVYRKSDANRIGLELEPSVGPGAYCRQEHGAVGALLMGQDGAFITGSDFLMGGGVTAAYWYGELAPK